MFHIIDDSEHIRELLVEMIESFGRRAMSFSSPVQYLEYFTSDGYTPPSAVLTDVHMPEMSGYQMMEKILVADPSIRFAVLSGEPSIPSEYKDKACMFLMKPFMGDHVKDMLNKFKRCEKEGASPDIGCFAFGDCAAFGVECRACPKLECRKQ